MPRRFAASIPSARSSRSSLASAAVVRVCHSGRATIARLSFRARLTRGCAALEEDAELVCRDQCVERRGPVGEELEELLSGDRCVRMVQQRLRLVERPRQAVEDRPGGAAEVVVDIAGVQRLAEPSDPEVERMGDRHAAAKQEAVDAFVPEVEEKPRQLGRAATAHIGKERETLTHPIVRTVAQRRGGEQRELLVPCEHAKHLGVLCALERSDEHDSELQLFAAPGLEQDRAKLGVERIRVARRIVAQSSPQGPHDRDLRSRLKELGHCVPRATVLSVGELAECPVELVHPFVDVVRRRPAWLAGRRRVLVVGKRLAARL